MDLKHYASRYIQPGAIRRSGWRDAIVGRLLADGAAVLDIGCASGAFAEKWADRKIRYSSVDYNGILVDHCRAKGFDAHRVDLSTEPLPFKDASFDFAYCSHVLEHLLSNQQIALFSEIARVMKPGGKLFLLTPTPYSWYFWDDPTHQRPSTHGSLEHLCRDAGLDPAQARYSLVRLFPQSLQKWLRLPPLRWFLWETYVIATKQK